MFFFFCALLYKRSFSFSFVSCLLRFFSFLNFLLIAAFPFLISYYCLFSFVTLPFTALSFPVFLFYSLTQYPFYSSFSFISLASSLSLLLRLFSLVFLPLRFTYFPSIPFPPPERNNEQINSVSILLLPPLPLTSYLLLLLPLFLFILFYIPFHFFTMGLILIHYFTR